MSDSTKKDELSTEKMKEMLKDANYYVAIEQEAGRRFISTIDVWAESFKQHPNVAGRLQDRNPHFGVHIRNEDGDKEVQLDFLLIPNHIGDGLSKAIEQKADRDVLAEAIVQLPGDAGDFENFEDFEYQDVDEDAENE